MTKTSIRLLIHLFVIGATFIAGVVACSAQAKAADAQTLNQFLATYRADVGSSVRLPDGRTLWLFGDTIRASGPWDRNSAVVQGTDGTTWDQIPGTFGTPEISGDWYWPGQAYIDYQRQGSDPQSVSDDGALRVLMAQFHCTADPCGSWDFAYVETDIVSYSLPDLTYRWTSDDVGGDKPGQFSQTFKDSYGRRYFYGAYKVDGQLGKAYNVAYVEASTAMSALGSTWKHLPNYYMPASLELGQVASVTRKPGTGRYYLFSKRLDMWTQDVVRYESSTPYGPWSSKTIVATLPQAEGDFTYSVEAHPEQLTTPGAPLVLTYATNGNLSHYGITAIEVANPMPTTPLRTFYRKPFRR